RQRQGKQRPPPQAARPLPPAPRQHAQAARHLERPVRQRLRDRLGQRRRLAEDGRPGREPDRPRVAGARPAPARRPDRGRQPVAVVEQHDARRFRQKRQHQAGGQRQQEAAGQLARPQRAQQQREGGGRQLDQHRRGEQGGGGPPAAPRRGGRGQQQQ